jgi:hypothetical protein
MCKREEKSGDGKVLKDLTLGVNGKLGQITVNQKLPRGSNLPAPKNIYNLIRYNNLATCS